MNVLILDDDKFRHEYFASVYRCSEDDLVVHAYRYSEFVTHLRSGVKWDIIYLDHDLGDLVANADYYVDGWGSKQPYNGKHAAAAICELDDVDLPREVIIQSVNGPGSHAMLAMLKRRFDHLDVNVSWQPFGESTLLIRH